MKYLICIALLLPIFFLPICHLHDWGDDFALYINQAKSISEKKPPSQNYFVYNHNYPSYSPKAYPIGFPILLALVDKISNNGIIAYQYFIILLCFLSGLLLFHIVIHLGHSILSALILALAIVYHPFIFAFREQVLADIPLLFFCLLFYAVYEENHWHRYSKIIALSFIASFAFSIKTIGLTLFLTYILCQILTVIQKKENGIALVKDVSLFVGFFIAFQWAIRAYFGDDGNSFSHFIKLTFSNNLVQIVSENLIVYKNEILAFWGNLGIFNRDVFAKSFSYLFLFTCLYSTIKIRDSKWNFLRIYTAVFLFSIFIFPNYNQGFRYFIPLLPFLFILFLNGFNSLIEKINIPIQYGQISILILFGYLYIAPNIAYTKGIKVRSDETALKYSPYAHANAINMRELKNFISEQDTLVTSYPRAFSLFLQRNCYTISPDTNSLNNLKEIASLHKFYILNYYPICKKSISSLIEHLHQFPSQYTIETLATTRDYDLYRCTSH